MSTTLVSALMHIDDPRPRLADKHRLHYRNWVKNVLGLDVPLVFHADRQYDLYASELTFKQRTFKGLLWRTKFEQLQVYKDFHAPVRALMESPAFLAKSFDHDGLQWTQPLYTILTFQKLYWLVETANQNPFDTDWFCWLDAGGIRHKIEPGLKWPNVEKLDAEKVNMFVVSPAGVIQTENWERHCLSHAAMIQGACVAAKKEPLQRFLQLFKEIVAECLRRGFIGSEQKMYDFCYASVPDLFKLHDASTVESEVKDVWFKFFDYLR